METRTLKIGRWHVEFYFGVYDMDVLLDRLYDFGAGASVMRQAMELMDSGSMNTGFTFSNPYDMVALVAIGPASSGEEFVDTLVHEIHHLAVAIAANLGIDLESEAPAYLAGDSARELASIVCRMGCDRCH